MPIKRVISTAAKKVAAAVKKAKAAKRVGSKAKKLDKDGKIIKSTSKKVAKKAKVKKSIKQKSIRDMNPSQRKAYLAKIRSNEKAGKRAAIEAGIHPGEFRSASTSLGPGYRTSSKNTMEALDRKTNPMLKLWNKNTGDFLAAGGEVINRGRKIPGMRKGK
tara:strand:- start:246 stop:728 length:483 start_codon:yes stop_codon:yes gene_type:complete